MPDPRVRVDVCQVDRRIKHLGHCSVQRCDAGSFSGGVPRIDNGNTGRQCGTGLMMADITRHHDIRVAVNKKRAAGTGNHGNGRNSTRSGDTDDTTELGGNPIRQLGELNWLAKSASPPDETGIRPCLDDIICRFLVRVGCN
jgi:hypothetical protein